MASLEKQPSVKESLIALAEKWESLEEVYDEFITGDFTPLTGREKQLIMTLTGQLRLNLDFLFPHG